MKTRLGHLVQVQVLWLVQVRMKTQRKQQKEQQQQHQQHQLPGQQL